MFHHECAAVSLNHGCLVITRLQIRHELFQVFREHLHPVGKRCWQNLARRRESATRQGGDSLVSNPTHGSYPMVQYQERRESSVGEKEIPILDTTLANSHKSRPIRWGTPYAAILLLQISRVRSNTHPHTPYNAGCIEDLHIQFLSSSRDTEVAVVLGGCYRRRLPRSVLRTCS